VLENGSYAAVARVFMDVYPGQLVPAALVEDLDRLLLAHRGGTNKPYDHTLKKELCAICRHGKIVGFLISQRKHYDIEPGKVVVRTSEEWCHYFFDEFEKAVVAFRTDRELG
jgi:hypothetical protein